MKGSKHHDRFEKQLRRQNLDPARDKCRFMRKMLEKHALACNSRAVAVVITDKPSLRDFAHENGLAVVAMKDLVERFATIHPEQTDTLLQALRSAATGGR